MKVQLLTKKQWHKKSCNSDSTKLLRRHRCRCRKYVRPIRKTSSILLICPSSFLTRWSISTAKSFKEIIMFANYQKNLLKHLISGRKQRISDLLLLFNRVSWNDNYGPGILIWARNIQGFAHFQEISRILHFY